MSDEQLTRRFEEVLAEAYEHYDDGKLVADIVLVYFFTLSSSMTMRHFSLKCTMKYRLSYIKHANRQY